MFSVLVSFSARSSFSSLASVSAPLTKLSSSGGNRDDVFFSFFLSSELDSPSYEK